MTQLSLTSFLPALREGLSPEFDYRHLSGLGSLCQRGVLSVVDPGHELSTVSVVVATDEVDDRLEVGERLTSPLLTNE